jgi:DNA-3-methyladenine glycosylase
MYYKGGVAYIYLCYGVHSLFNVVTNIEGVPDAILIRGIKPMIGKEIMSLRTNKITITPFSGKGPGLVSKLLGIHYSLSGENLTGNKIWIEDRNTQFDKTKIIQTTRIGVAYAGKDALLPYRFYLSPENL